MSRYTPEQLREHAMRELEILAGTPDPSDEVVLEIYSRLQEQMYPTQVSDESLRGKAVRERAKMLRRSIEFLYPWVRSNKAVKEIQLRRNMVTSVSVFPDFESNTSGLVVLQGATLSGKPSILRYKGLYAADALAERYTPDRPAPLSVLLAHLLHIEKVVTESTPVQVFRYDTRSRPGQAVAVLVGSAMPLSQFLEEA
jgi:hypothetical protein